MKKILEVKIEIAIMNSKTDVEVRDIRSGAVVLLGLWVLEMELRVLEVELRVLEMELRVLEVEQRVLKIE